QADAANPHRLLLRTQDAQPTTGLDAEDLRPTLVRDVVGAVAEEDEIAVAEPAQELADLVALGSALRVTFGICLDETDRLVERLDHRPEIVRGGDHVFEASLDLGGDLGAA